MGVSLAPLSAPDRRLRPGQVIEIYHAAVGNSEPRRPKCAHWLADHGYLHEWFWLPGLPQYTVTRKGWQALKRHWHLIADKVHGYPKARR